MDFTFPLPTGFARIYPDSAFVAPWHSASKPKSIQWENCADAAHSWLIALNFHLLSQTSPKARLWVIDSRHKNRERLAQELETWQVPALLFPEPPAQLNDLTIADPDAATEWFVALQTLADAPPRVVILSPEAWLSAAPRPQALQEAKTRFVVGQQLDPGNFLEQLAEQGYQRCPLVVSRGQVAQRGGIIDLFPWQAIHPLRLEFFDTELESIREFDLDSQTSIAKLTSYEILAEEPKSLGSLADYARRDDEFLAIEPTEENLPYPKPVHAIFCGSAPGAESLEENFQTACFANPFPVFEAGDFVLEQSRREQFFAQLAEWKTKKWQVFLVFPNAGERERFEELAGKSFLKLGITPLQGELFHSFSIPSVGLAAISSSELFGRYRTVTRKQHHPISRARHAVTTPLDELENGDLVVHHEYGIGKFRGIHASPEGDVLHIEYRNDALLTVPLEHAHLVAKYVGMGGKTPDLHQLGSSSWKTARKSAEKSIQDYAAQLLRVQAERSTQHGYAFPPDSHWMMEFEQSFHFAETPDQKTAILDAKSDMESPLAMDRLICGDVGFGKTEVAIRAAFKAVTSGKQAVLLCPTTVLAEQHFRTFRERMSDYPVQIELLNRYRTAAQSKQTLENLATGATDIVIGTHKLLSPSLAFKNLGLAVIDEEQRFGVKHKEAFKARYRQIDLLTLSATPIPRTLYMALMGARDMSTIETPPPNRIPVHTTISPYDERVIRDAIEREMKRGGQVFFLHNRVQTIEHVARKIRELVPKARVLVGHGQMEKDALESVMHTFVRGEADVLLATTIIETGIDIPNANTILIDRADRFGLADLYQLRGRVGRSGEQAYAILLLPRDMLTQGDARKRIHAIKQYTELGSGFKIAMRDLEIRGAGNLLGTKQSGHIAQIGFDLYCQLLKQSVTALKGGKAQATYAQVTFKSDFTSLQEATWNQADREKIPAFLPISWLPDTAARLSAFRQLAEISNETQYQQLATRWQDQFGRLPAPVRNLLSITHLKALALQRNISSVEIQAQRLMLHRNGNYITIEASRFPRLKSTKPLEKIQETIALLRSF